jgi:hypothetical protein
LHYIASRSSRYGISFSLIDDSSYIRHNYHDPRSGCDGDMHQPIEEVMTLIAIRPKIPVDEIEQIFDLPGKSTHNIIDFLEFDFVRLV